MTTIFDTILEARVDARNRVNAEANRLGPLLVAAFTPLVGQKIMKADGIMEKFKHIIPVPLQGFDLFRPSSKYTLQFTVRTTGWYKHPTPGYGNSVVYEEESIYIGEWQNNGGLVLEKVYSFDPRRTDWTPEIVRNLRRARLEAESAMRHAESHLGPFGNYDR
jgi:hypothetical protein